MKKRHPAAGVVCYVNTCAEIKAESDACCTPANAVAVVEAMLQDEIVFIPDRLVTEFKDREIVSTCNLCPCMKQIQLDDVLKTLKEPAPEQFVELPPEIAVRAREALDRMFVLEKNGSAILEQRGARGLPWIA